MKSTSPTRQRKALIDLRTDEEVYEVGFKNDDEALEGLELLRKELPRWMWKEIERLTDLRLKTKDENWEIDSADDIEARYDYRWRHYREILVNWKKEHLTGWREEHDRSNRLIVTRAVCQRSRRAYPAPARPYSPRRVDRQAGMVSAQRKGPQAFRTA